MSQHTVSYDTLVTAKDEMWNLLSAIMLHEFGDEETELAKCHMISGRPPRAVARTVDHLKYWNNAESNSVFKHSPDSSELSVFCSNQNATCGYFACIWEFDKTGIWTEHMERVTPILVASDYYMFPHIHVAQLHLVLVYETKNNHLTNNIWSITLWRKLSGKFQLFHSI